ncbi:MAG: transposase [Spartobacteria bacterium]|nr:transposase [Spartobacteria bacterium]
MRRKRIKRERLAYYHCMTRVVGRQMLLGEAEKKHMRWLIRKVEGFTGVRVLTYALMTNHIHLLLEEPDRECDVSDELLMQRMKSLYSEGEMAEIEARWINWQTQNNNQAIAEDKRRYTRRMHDISEFMKTLKHRFSFWYNRLNNRKGTLWSERFKSVLVEGGEALCAVAAYIELNPVRAGLVKDPALYCFCGYGDAVAGSGQAQNGIIDVMVHKGASFGRNTERSWQKQSVRYLDEVLCFGHMNIEGDNPLAQCLLQRCRYFTDGQVLGSKSFVEAFFLENRDYFGPRRMCGGRKVKGAGDALYAIRDVSRGGGDV